MLLMNLSKQFLRSITTAKKKWTNTLTKIWSKVKKNNIYFNKVTIVRFVKNLLIMIYVRDQCHVTGKVRGASTLELNISI